MSYFFKRNFNSSLLPEFSPATCFVPVTFSGKKMWTHCCMISCVLHILILCDWGNSVCWRIGMEFLYFSSLVFRRPNFPYDNARKKTLQANYFTCLSIKKIYCAFHSWRLIYTSFFRKFWLFHNFIFLFRKNSTFFINHALKFKYPSRSDRG
jgi:hypothetical protein